MAITAPTGIASLNIGGRTIHSFAGIGLGTDTAENLVEKIIGSKTLFRRWVGTSVLIIDESESLSLFGVMNSNLLEAQSPCWMQDFLISLLEF